MLRRLVEVLEELVFNECSKHAGYHKQGQEQFSGAAQPSNEVSDLRGQLSKLTSLVSQMVTRRSQRVQACRISSFMSHPEQACPRLQWSLIPRDYSMGGFPSHLGDDFCRSR
ncbi:uncharacterized protein LOC120091514 [Benincasa hispida]|uniref:uncharacterized protein LOC120091514 n=1 Tax=Benincasa hispida TaxID=102211 RepID=UPI001901E650|nr:uncharacterized protein LOC120091514 [Benincasa hispida]